MEQNFQTSFIPKKPIIENRVVSTRPVSLLVILSIFILFTVLVATGGLYFYKVRLTKSITYLQENLNTAKSRFEPSKLVLLQTLDKRLRAATTILDSHVTVSPIFQALQDLTMKTVRYTKFTYSLMADKKINVKMSGVAIGYSSVALQSDLFAKNKNLLIDPVFSNLTLDEKGNVVFDLEFLVDGNFVKYKQNILTQS